MASCSADSSLTAQHVVVISLDTTRADHIGAYGSKVKTPHIDALAEESVVFLNASVPATMTLPSHVSLMTGIWPTGHGVVRNGFTVDDANVMLAEILSEAGFKSAGFSAAIALSGLLNFPQGFDLWDQDPDKFEGHVIAHASARRADEITDATIAYLDDSTAAHHFLFVHYVDPHLPYDPPEPYRSMYGEVPADLTGTFETVQASRALHRDTAANNSGPSSKPLPKLLTAELISGAQGRPIGIDEILARLYAGEVTFMDHHLGRLFEDLDRRGILDQALVIITSDHGETFWEHADAWNHGLAVYETNVHVPLILRFPGAEHRGKRISPTVSNVDLVPTILDYLGLTLSKSLDGESLLPLLDGQTLRRKAVYSVAPKGTHAVENNTRWKNERKPNSIRRGRWKYVRTPYLNLEELYDLESDPTEQNNLLRSAAPEARSRANDLRAELEQWLAASDPLPSAYFPRVTAKMNPREAAERRRMEEQLRALGYVGDEDGDAPE